MPQSIVVDPAIVVVACGGTVVAAAVTVLLSLSSSSSILIDVESRTNVDKFSCGLSMNVLEDSKQRKLFAKPRTFPFQLPNPRPPWC